MAEKEAPKPKFKLVDHTEAGPTERKAAKVDKETVLDKKTGLKKIEYI